MKKIHRKILIVAPYPIINPQHGGQKRAKAIFEYYKTIFTDVKFVGVFHRGHYPDYAETDMPLGDINLIRKIDAHRHETELIVGKAIDNDIHVRSHMAKLLMEFQPDVVQVEQIFPYLGLDPLIKELGLHPKLVLSSQNIEYRMKEEIYRNLDFPKEQSRPLIEKTKKT
ncbi:hypothetical protein TM7_0174 [candidate division TM7 genomosp. GTL1]|nr:hypothetical protein TM7_0174 [candidate division TM7 genomosp. GTL1]